MEGVKSKKEKTKIDRIEKRAAEQVAEPRRRGKCRKRSSPSRARMSEDEGEEQGDAPREEPVPESMDTTPASDSMHAVDAGEDSDEVPLISRRSARLQGLPPEICTSLHAKAGRTSTGSVGADSVRDVGKGEDDASDVVPLSSLGT
eukprot:403497-Amphidinium_carterae.1